jgi:DNA (cytosine-5)-methyltransferase 1
MTTITTLFSGGEGIGTGARAAGLTHLLGIEHSDPIANVARNNGFNVITADIMSIDPATLEVPDVLHASPACKRASTANQSAELNEDGTKEVLEDIAAGEKVAQFIDVMKPRCFTLENVYAYRHFKAFKIICNALNQGGYMWDFDNINAADYGVPQTRRRLFLRAVRGALLPNLPGPERWVSWYESITDLIPTLPESELAPWQMVGIKPNQSFIVGSQYGQPNNIKNRTVMLRGKTEPIFTMTVSGITHNDVKAVLIDGQNAGRGVTIRNHTKPAFTVVSPNKGAARALFESGRCVSMNMAAYGRFQSFPDDYKNMTPAVVGNAVPPLLYQKIIAPLVEVIR